MARVPVGGTSSGTTAAPAPTTGSSSGAYVGWDPKKYDVPISQGYFVSVGMRPDVSQINNPSSSFYGKVGATPIYSSPAYKVTDLNSLAGKPPAQVWAVQQALYNAGILKSGFLAGTYDEATRTALEKVMYVANLNGISISEVFRRQDLIRQAYGAAGYGTSGGSGGGGGGGGGGAGGTYTQSQITLTSAAQAKGILASALAQQLGRQPTENEVQDFVGLLNRQQKANPTVTTTTVSADGKVQASTTKQGNVDPQQSAEDFATTVSPEERSKFQGANYYAIIAQKLGI